MNAKAEALKALSALLQEATELWAIFNQSQRTATQNAARTSGRD